MKQCIDDVVPMQVEGLGFIGLSKWSIYYYDILGAEI